MITMPVFVWHCRYPMSKMDPFFGRRGNQPIFWRGDDAATLRCLHYQGSGPESGWVGLPSEPPSIAAIRHSHNRLVFFRFLKANVWFFPLKIRFVPIRARWSIATGVETGHLFHITLPPFQVSPAFSHEVNLKLDDQELLGTQRLRSVMVCESGWI